MPGPLPSLWRVAGNLWCYVACRRVTSSPHGRLPVCLCPNLLFIKEQEPVCSSRTSSSLIASVMTLFPKRSQSEVLGSGLQHMNGGADTV